MSSWLLILMISDKPPSWKSEWGVGWKGLIKEGEQQVEIVTDNSLTPPDGRLFKWPGSITYGLQHYALAMDDILSPRCVCDHHPSSSWVTMYSLHTHHHYPSLLILLLLMLLCCVNTSYLSQEHFPDLIWDELVFKCSPSSDMIYEAGSAQMVLIQTRWIPRHCLRWLIEV